MKEELVEKEARATMVATVQALWEDAYPAPEAIFTPTHEELVQQAILYGTEFNANNGKV